MSLSFLELKCLMEDNYDPPSGTLMGSGEDSRAMKVVRVGMNLREAEDSEEFWQDFISLCSDSEGMADLLGVKAAEVRRWAARIKDTIEQVKDMDSSNPEGEDDSKVVPTGNGPMTIDDQGFAGN